MSVARRLQALGGALLLAFSVTAFAAEAARAAQEEIPLEKQAWFWESSRRVNVPGTGIQQEPPNPHAPGHLPVSLQSGNPDKRTYLQWDVTAMEGGDVQEFVFTLHVSPTSPEHGQEHAAEQQPPPQTLNDGAAVIVICPVEADGFIPDGAEGEPSTVTTVTESGEPTEVRQEPTFDCSLGEVEMTRSEDGATWSADIASIAQLWADRSLPNNGVVVRPSVPETPDLRETWQVEFHGTPHADVSASVTYTPGEEPPMVLGGFSGGETQATTRGFAAPRSDTGGTFTESIPPQPGTPGSQRIVERPGGAVRDPGAGAGELPWYVWLLVPVGATGIYLMARALRPEWAEQLAARENRIATLLRTRRTGVATA